MIASGGVVNTQISMFPQKKSHEERSGDHGGHLILCYNAITRLLKTSVNLSLTARSLSFGFQHTAIFKLVVEEFLQL